MSPARPLSDSERRDWIRLSRTQNVGPVTFAQLLKRFGSPAAAIDALSDIARRAGRGRPSPPRRLTRSRPRSRRRSNMARASWPAAKQTSPRSCAPLPPILTLLGCASLAAQPTVAIVGARNASAAGRKLARDIAAGLGEAGFVTVSGLALGIDGEAHAATLRTGTIAVLGGAIDHVYPPQHERLYAEIAAEGLLVSESPFGYRRQGPGFPETQPHHHRNRPWHCRGRNRRTLGLADLSAHGRRTGARGHGRAGIATGPARSRHQCPALSGSFAGPPRG